MAVVSSHTDFLQYTTEWITRLNRGGLFPVNDQTFLFFATIEKLVQVHLPSRLKRPKEIVKCDIIEMVMDHTLIQQQWVRLSQDIESENDVSDLLKEVVTKWVTIRVFH